ncbi:MAG: flagellar basal body protein [Caulobacteraceae bacterium]|nr:flagellar basal body protein [Caulobacteraceae bacterium]
MTTANHTSYQRIQDLIALTEQLTALIAEQAQAFEGRRPQDAARNMEETSRLANIYRREAQSLRADSVQLAQAPLEQRVRLIRATEAFDAVMARQGRALTAAKTVTEGLVHAIAHEVAAQRTKGVGYGPSGAAPRTGPVTAVTLNQRA